MRREKILFILVTSVFMAASAFGGEPILGPNDPIIAVDAQGLVTSSNYPATEVPANILDGNPATKYLNRGGGGSGFIVTPASPIMVQSFVLTTANDSVTRDPNAWELYGTNDPIKSIDNSTGTAENWTLIASGKLQLPAARSTVCPPVSFESLAVYSSFTESSISKVTI